VTLRFADGTRATAAAVVGADGIRSAVRQRTAGDVPRYSGQTVYRGMVPAGRVPALFTEPRSILWAGPGRHFVCYPVAGGAQVNFVATVPAPSWPTESWSEPGEPADVLAAFTGWDPAIRALVEKADAVTRWAVHIRDAAGPWSSGRVTLAGDAAHPMTPFMAQGANQGIEDALALAAALRDDADIPAALRRYEAARLPRTARVQQASSDLAGTFHQADGDQQRQRDRELAGAGVLQAVGWLFGHDAELLDAQA
jgi:salicylate hydroxylase